MPAAERTSSTPPAEADLSEVPIAVDLDGTLVRTDLMWEGLVRAILRRPWRLVGLAAALLGGKAAFKRAVASAGPVEAAVLPYREDLLTWLGEQRAAGRRIVLATAADRVPAEAVARAAGVFDEVLASDTGRNLSGPAKAKALVERFGTGGFDYAGDHPRKDGPVFRVARACIPAGRPWLEAALRDLDRPIAASFADNHSVIGAILRAMRVHQWTKNLLVLVPLLTAHLVLDAASWAKAGLAFLAFSLLASGTYLLNDLHDLDADRAHPSKRRRPIAAGELPIPIALAAAAGLVAGGLAIGVSMLPPAFATALLAYLALTVAYSLVLKRRVLVDVIALSLLYALRVYAGAAAIEVPLSEWLLVYTLFVFTSLAFLKRYVELKRRPAEVAERVPGRGYVPADAKVIGVAGPAIGLMSVMVLALYVQTPTVESLYASPGLLWLLLPLTTWWMVRIWFLAERGEVDDDPVAFAIRDRGTQAVVVLMAAVAILAWKWG